MKDFLALIGFIFIVLIFINNWAIYGWLTKQAWGF